MHFSLIASLVLVACSSMSGADRSLTDQTETDGSPSTTSSASTPAVDTGSLDVPDPEYYGFEAEFALDAAGNWQPGAVLTVDLYVVPDPAYPDTVARLCSIPVDIEVTVDVAPAEDLAVWSWWKLSLAPAGGTESGCPGWAGREWLLGAGAYDPRLDPAIYAADLAGTELFGLYIREDEAAPLYVMGVVGTTAMFGGKTGLAVPPLAEGDYTARSLILLSL